MSSTEIARRTVAEIVFDGVNITDSIRPYLLSITYTDNEEDATDDLQIKLADRENIWLCQWLNDMIQAAASTQDTSERAATPNYRVTAQSGLNVRNGPGTNYAKVGMLTYGTTVSVISTSNGWSTIHHGTGTAYVYSDYLMPLDGSASMPSVSRGSVGSAVRTMQEYLVQLGYQLPVYGIDGYFESETRAAVIAFQRDHGLDQDGICGPLTWAAIFKSLAGDSTPAAQQSQGFALQAVILANNDGYDKVLDCGQFELDAVSASGPPAEITIKGTSLPYTAQIRQTQKSKAWEAYTLSGIAREMAARNGMACLYESASDPYYDRVEQVKQSDIAFLSVLCHNVGISLKATSNMLVLFDQPAYEVREPIRTIRRGDHSYTKYKLSTGKADTQYDSCRVSYMASGACIEAIAYVDDYKADKESNQQLEVTAKVSSVAEAQALAQKRLRLHNKYAQTASFTLPGAPDMVSGVTVLLAGFGAWDGKYIIKQARHSVGSSGYTTAVTLRRVLEGY